MTGINYLIAGWVQELNQHRFYHKMKYLLIIILGCISINIKGQTHDYLAEYAKGYRGGYIKGQQSRDGALEFVAIGDFGRGGEYFQKDVAANLAKAVTGINASFIISTGDNIYPDGVASVNDPLWRLSFEDVFYQYPLHRPWYAVLGNHDYHGNAQAQVDYSGTSQRWNMPARYYAIKKSINDSARALFVFIDTNTLDPESYGATYAEELREQDSTKQLLWLDSILSNPGADVQWKIVIGHHPCYTAGNRALRKPYIRYALENMLEKYKVDIYLSGHEHHLQYYHPGEKFTHHIISGAGSEANESLKPRSEVDYFAPIQGFVTFSILPRNILLQFINRKEEIIKNVSWYK